MSVNVDRMAEINQCHGFFKAVFIGESPDGTPLYGLSGEDFRKIRDSKR